MYLRTTFLIRLDSGEPSESFYDLLSLKFIYNLARLCNLRAHKAKITPDFRLIMNVSSFCGFD